MYSPFWQNDKNTIILYNVKRKMLQKTGSRFGLRWCDKSYYKPLKNYCRFWAVRKKYTSEMRSDEGSGDDDSSRLSKVEIFWRFWGLYLWIKIFMLCVSFLIFFSKMSFWSPKSCWFETLALFVLIQVIFRAFGGSTRAPGQLINFSSTMPLKSRWWRVVFSCRWLGILAFDLEV